MLVRGVATVAVAAAVDVLFAHHMPLKTRHIASYVLNSLVRSFVRLFVRSFARSCMLTCDAQVCSIHITSRSAAPMLYILWHQC